MKDESAGLLAAAFIGIVPGYISRSVAGSYDNEAIAIFLLMFTFYCWIKALKQGSALFGTMAAVFYFYMVAAWGMFRNLLYCQSVIFHFTRWLCLYHQHNSIARTGVSVDGPVLRSPLRSLFIVVCHRDTVQYASAFCWVPARQYERTYGGTWYDLFLSSTYLVMNLG